MPLRVYFDESLVRRFEAVPGDSGSDRPRVGHRLLVGAIVVPDGPTLEAAVAERAKMVLADPSMWIHRPPPPGNADRRAAFATEHFHFTLDSDSIRKSALDVMLAQEFRAHIFYSHMTDPMLSRTAVQTAMYFTLIRTLLQRYAGSTLELVFENEPSMDQHYGKIVKHALDSLDRVTAKKPRQPRATVTAKKAYKPDGGIATVDYCLAIVNHGLQEEHQDSARPIESFRLETLTGLDAHIAHVADFDKARHRHRFDMLNSPSWARHIAAANSHSGVNDPFVTSIGGAPTGHFDYVRDVASLASALGKTPDALAEAFRLAAEPTSYKVRTIKIRGKWRELAQPVDPVLDSALRRVADFLRPLNDILHPSCSAYVPGRSSRDAAGPHAGHLWVQKLDIKSFFPSTTTQQVIETLKSLGATPDVARMLGGLTTFRNQLTTGARTSPLVSNLVLARFDYTISDASARNNVTYTRYADDLIFSGNTRFDMSRDVATELAPLGYRINPSKSVLRRRGQPVKIAGLTVFETDAPRLPKPMKRRLRLELFLLSKAAVAGLETLSLDEDDPEYDAACRLARIQGLYRYGRSIEPEWCQRLLERYPAVEPLMHQRSDTASTRSQATAALVQRIVSTVAPTLTTAFQPIGGSPPQDSA